jgi:hypothetical protein
MPLACHPERSEESVVTTKEMMQQEFYCKIVYSSIHRSLVPRDDKLEKAQ